MKVPLIPRVGALVLATTGFYTYVGQMVPQKEVQPPAEIVLKTDLTTADMVKVGREIMEGKGLCFTCHTIGKSGALRFPDLAGVAARAKTREPGLSDVEYFAQAMYEPDAFIVPGFNPGMPADQQASDRPHRSGDPLRDRVPADAWRHADGDAPDEASLQRRAAAATAPHPPPASRPVGRSLRPHSRGRSDEASRSFSPWLSPSGCFASCGPTCWSGPAHGWLGIYVLLRFGFTAPIPSSVITIYMGIVSLAILAYVSSSQQRRDEVSGPLVRFMTEKRYTRAACRDGRRRSRRSRRRTSTCRMNVPLEPPLFSRTVHPASPADITVHDKKIDLDAGENPFRHLESSNPQEFRTHVENGRKVYYQNCVFCHGDNLAGNGMFAHGLDPIPTNFHDTIPSFARRFCSGASRREGPGCPTKAVPGTRPCHRGRSS